MEETRLKEKICALVKSKTENNFLWLKFLWCKTVGIKSDFYANDSGLKEVKKVGTWRHKMRVDMRWKNFPQDLSNTKLFFCCSSRMASTTAFLRASWNVCGTHWMNPYQTLTLSMPNHRKNEWKSFFHSLLSFLPWQIKEYIILCKNHKNVL